MGKAAEAFIKNILRLGEQAELAEKAGLARQTVYRWTTRKRSPDLDQIEKIANVTGIPAWELIKPDEPPKPEQDLTIADLKKQLDRIEDLLRKR